MNCRSQVVRLKLDGPEMYLLVLSFTAVRGEEQRQVKRICETIPCTEAPYSDMDRRVVDVHMAPAAHKGPARALRKRLRWLECDVMTRLGYSVIDTALHSSHAKLSDLRVVTIFSHTVSGLARI